MPHSWTRLIQPAGDIPDAPSPMPHTFPYKDPQNIASEGKLGTCVTLIFHLPLLLTRGEISFVRAGIVLVLANTMHRLSSASCRLGDVCLGIQAVNSSYPSPVTASLCLPFVNISWVQGRRQRHAGKKNALRLSLHFEEPKRQETNPTGNQF